MKQIIAASSFLIAAFAMPSAGLSQDAVQDATIIVSGKFQKDWQKGSKLEAEGLKSLEGARSDLIKYSAAVVDAQNKRDSSGARGDNAASEFRRLTTDVPYFSDPVEAHRWARQVDKSAGDWAKHGGRADDGRDDLAKAMKKQNDAQSSVDKAQLKVDRGRQMKTEAERMSRLSTIN